MHAARSAADSGARVMQQPPRAGHTAAPRTAQCATLRVRGIFKMQKVRGCARRCAPVCAMRASTIYIRARAQRQRATRCAERRQREVVRRRAARAQQERTRGRKTRVSARRKVWGKKKKACMHAWKREGVGKFQKPNQKETMKDAYRRRMDDAEKWETKERVRMRDVCPVCPTSQSSWNCPLSVHCLLF